MFSCEHLDHPFQQDAGTGQDQRLPDNLGERSAPIDGRQVSDLLNYFSGLAGQIKFYSWEQGDPGLRVTDWRTFFQNHLPFQLSRMGVLSGDDIRNGMASAVGMFGRNPSANGLQLLFLQTYYTAIFPVQQWSILLSQTRLDVKARLNTLIKDRLVGPLQSYISWLNTAVFFWKIQPPDLTGLSPNPVWALTPALLSAYEAGFSPTVPNTRSQLMAVQTALTGIGNAFADVVDMASGGVADLVNKQLYMLLQNNGQADTPPQLALLYSFLCQYHKVLKDLNGLTQKQLNFFFQQVLNLPPGPAVADQAYIVFSIQKQLPSYIIPATTSLKAGKDAKGADIYFQLNSDLIANQAQLGALQTVFVNTQARGTEKYVEGVYIAPNAQMADGVSKPFTGAAAWPSLGAKQSLYTPPGATSPIDYPRARLGFVLASKALYLKEGKRKIHIQLVCQWDPGTPGGDQGGPGSGVCSDGVAFGDIFPLAQKSVCARFVVVTQDIIDQAKQVGVSDATIANMWERYLLDTSERQNPCDGAPDVYRDKYLLWIPCCSKEQAEGGEQQPGIVDSSAGGEGVRPEEARLRSEIGGQRPEMDEQPRIEALEFVSTQQETPEMEEPPVKRVELDVSKRCPDVWEEESCKASAKLALKEELESVAATDKQNQVPNPRVKEDVKILQGLLTLKTLFDVQFSGEKGWQAPDYLDMRLELVPAVGADANPQFVWHIEASIDTGSPGIVFYDPKKLGEDLHVTDPLVKVTLNNDIAWAVNGEAVPATTTCLDEMGIPDDGEVSPYEFFRNVTLLVPNADVKPAPKHRMELMELEQLQSPAKQVATPKTQIEVTVCGVKTLVVQNDANLMDVNKAFTPFGAKPLIPDFMPIDTGQGTHTGIIDGPNFLVGSTEVLLKKWTDLYVNMSWLSKPHDFDEYYKGYVPHDWLHHGKLHLHDNYKVNLAVLENAVWHPAKEEFWDLFPGHGSRSFPVCCNNKFDDSFHITPDDFEDPAKKMYDPDFTPLTKWAAGMQRGFLRFTLEKQDFLHRYYPWVMGRAMRYPGEYPNVINEPWTPTIIPGMSMDYKAIAEPEDMTLVQLYPFDGTSNVTNIYGRPTLMPKFCDEGNLFIGFTGLVPGQILSLLFQLAEGTGGSTGAGGVSGSGASTAGGGAGSGGAGDGVSWQYLATDEWKPLRYGFEVVSDGTQGLMRTGIIQFKIPDDIGNTSTMLPSGNYWILASMADNTETTSRTVAVLTQAGLATYAPVAGINDPARSATPLDANSITKLTQPDASIIKVIQPYASFGGSAPENTGDAYVLRVSEGLRHRGRAIQQWDFERLVLQQYPMLSRVKCINHSQYLDAGQYKFDFPIAPGSILLAVLPDTNLLAVADQLQPNVPVSLLTGIQTFLQGMQSPFISVRVAGPRYEPVTICATVEFQKNENNPARIAQLEQEIEDFLAPWLGGNMDKFEFAQPLNFADVANLIQSQAYVAHLVKLAMCHADEKPVTANQQGYISPRTPRSILVAGTVFVNAK